MVAALGPILDRCDVPRIAASGLAWTTFAKYRGSQGVLPTGLFQDSELSAWGEADVLRRHGNESFYADNTRGNYNFPKLAEYVTARRPERMIFVSDTLRGAFGRAWRMATHGPRRKLFMDFAERPIFSVGVAGGAVPTHDSHPETWHALLNGVKAWWLGRKSESALFRGWEDPCGMIEQSLQGEVLPSGVQLCVQHAGEVLYFGTGVEHSTCTLSNFSLAVGSQGHTETWPELVRAANRGDLARVKQLLRLARAEELQDLLSKSAGSYGHTALHRAALHGFERVVAVLLEKGAEGTQQDLEGLTPSFLSAFSGHKEVLQTLLKHGIQLSREIDTKGATPLQWAATQGHHAVVDLLLTHKMSPETRDFHGGGPVSASATMGHVEVLHRLVEEKANVEESDDRGMRPLHWAALHGHGLVVKHLLRLRARNDPFNSDGRRPLDLALAHSRHEVVQAMQTGHRKELYKTQKLAQREL
ncbi:INVS [Symbiodinium microadriaticum]|nr:INVS [Symbiodinium microadriaticum]